MGTAGRSLQAVDTKLGSVTRFLTELVAWVALPWAASHVSWVFAVVVIAVVPAIVATFNFPGDKRHVGIAVPGWVRIGIELLLFAGALVGAVIAWPTWAWVLVAVLVAVTTVAQFARWRWLLSGTAAA